MKKAVFRSRIFVQIKQRIFVQIFPYIAGLPFVSLTESLTERMVFMKRSFMTLCALCLTLTGCGLHTAEAPAALPSETTGVTASPQPDTVPDIQTFTDSYGTVFMLDRQKYSENLRVYTHDDIWISYMQCGYLSDMKRNSRWVIRSQADLDAFNAKFGLKLEMPDEYPNHGEDVENPYDFEHDAMLIEYCEVNSDGYDLRPAALLIDGDAVNFVMDTQSKVPEGEAGEMMDGFLWLAALPESVLPEPPAGWSYFKADAEQVTEPPADETDDCYMKPASDADIVTDAETGIRYVKNQLLVSCALDTDREQVEKLAKDVGAEIVGAIALTCDYQFEWTEDKTADELQALADRIGSYPFVENVTLNMVHEINTDE